MFMKLNQEIIDLLCCPLCKSKLNSEKDKFVCANCATQYPLISVHVGNHDEQTYDFRIHRPSYSISRTSRLWHDGQQDYEKHDENVSVRDDLRVYLDEIDSVKEIYLQEFHIQGTVLDVGGHQGRLRHFLSDRGTSLYVSIDPFSNVFENIQHRPNLLKAYPCLSEPCNFLAGRAEELPFISNSFDWVHMRSVVDHFEDPFKAFKEAYRVLRPDGHLMIGLAIVEKLEVDPVPLWTRVKLKLERNGMISLLKAVQTRIAGIARREAGESTDHHIFRLTDAELRDLLSVTGFEIRKEHWQKPPFTFCIYLTASPGKTN